MLSHLPGNTSLILWTKSNFESIPMTAFLFAINPFPVSRGSLNQLTPEHASCFCNGGFATSDVLPRL